MIPAIRPQLPPNKSIVPPDQQGRANIQSHIFHPPAGLQKFTCRPLIQRSCVKEATSGSLYLFNRVKHKHTRADDGCYQSDPIAKGDRSTIYPTRNWEPECPEEKDYITKVPTQYPSCIQATIKEREVLKKLQDCPFIVKLLRHPSSDNSFSMERLPDNLYQSHLYPGKRMSHAEFTVFAHQIFIALREMKKLGIIHADLKPENMAKKKTQAKLFDFNLAQEEDKKSTQDLLSSSFYRPPENVLEFETYTCAYDMWSFACCLYELVTLRPLFHYQDTWGDRECHFFTRAEQLFGLFPPDHMIAKARNKKAVECLQVLLCAGRPLPKLSIPDPITQRLEKHLSPEDAAPLSDLIHKMMRYDPAERITPEEALKHPFFKDCFVKPSEDDHKE